MDNLPSIRELISKKQQERQVKWIGVYQQEAHDTEIWPIALPGALSPTFTVQQRKEKRQCAFKTESILERRS